MQYMIGFSDVLVGNFPKLAYDSSRRIVAALGVGILLGAGMNGDGEVAVVAGIVYGTARLFPRFRGYKEYWRFGR